MKKFIAKIRTAVENYERDPVKRNIQALLEKQYRGETLTDGQVQMLKNLQSKARGESPFGA